MNKEKSIVEEILNYLENFEVDITSDRLEFFKEDIPILLKALWLLYNEYPEGE